MGGVFGCSSRMNGKPSSPVLRGLGASNGARLLDSNRITSELCINSSEPNNGWPIHGSATTRQLEFHTRYGVRKRIRHRPLFSAKRFHRVDPRSSPCRYV